MKSVNDMSKNELNCVINSDGTPKYSAGKLSHISIETLRGEATEALEQRRKPVKPIGVKRGRKYGASTNKASAMVKKSNLLKSIADGTKSRDIAKDIVSADSFLINLWPNWEQDIDNGVRPSKREVNSEIVVNLHGDIAKFVYDNIVKIFGVKLLLVETEKGYNIICQEKLVNSVKLEITYFVMGLLTERN